MGIRVLVFPAGEMNSAELCFALSRQVNVELYGASSVERLGRHLFTRYRNDLPMISDPDFIDVFRAQLLDWKIDVLIPTHDTVVEYLSQNRDLFPCKLLLPTRETADVCRDKSLAMQMFVGEDFAPAIYESPTELPESDIFVKPKRGQGAIGARRVKSGSPALAEIDWGTELVCEFLPGEELTVDCFTDRHGALLGIFPRSRDRVLGGITVAGTTHSVDADILHIAQTINNRLGFLGLWFLQVKRSIDGRWKLLEISARCSGTQCLTRARGVNLPLLSVYAAMGKEVALFENAVPLKMDRLLMPMFDFEYNFTAAYIDYDDTMVHKDGVDPEIMRLIYQFKRDGIRTFLITRHEGDLETHMARHCIHAGLFDQIIHITDDTPKAGYIEPGEAIFIDNAYAERRNVHQQHGIPVFDVEGAQVLKRWLQ